MLVNNAATEPQTRFHVLTPAEIEYVLQVDLISPLLLARLLLPGMLERRYGRIINISSLAGHTSFPYTEAYAAAKDGLTAFSRVLHSDYRDTGVTATSIILGPVKDAGVSARTLAETGLTASTAFSVSPQKVAAATLRAIGNPKAEIVVSIGPGRLLKALMDYFPGLGPALNRLSGADKLMVRRRLPGSHPCPQDRRRARACRLQHARAGARRRTATTPPAVLAARGGPERRSQPSRWPRWPASPPLARPDRTGSSVAAAPAAEPHVRTRRPSPPGQDTSGDGACRTRPSNEYPSSRRRPCPEAIHAPVPAARMAAAR